jgi:hypothetical protein
MTDTTTHATRRRADRSCRLLVAAPLALGAGELSQKPGRAGCVSEDGTGGLCQDGRPGDFGQPLARASQPGDTLVDDPGASRTPRVRRPGNNRGRRLGWTIVRHIDEVLPVVMSSAALLVALGAAFLCVASIRRRRLAAPTDRIVCKRRRGATEWARAGARGVTRPVNTADPRETTHEPARIYCRRLTV